MNEIPITPFCKLEDKRFIPDPRSIIQIAISDYRKSDLSDKELAEYICANLSLIMKSNKAHIEVFDIQNIVFKSD